MWVLRKKFDYDRLGRIAQIVDHVLQHLNKLDLDGWLRLVNLAPDIFHNFVDPAFAVAVKSYGKVAAIRFRHRGYAKLQPSASRGISHLRRRSENLFNVIQDAIRLRQGTSRRGVVIENEAALVHARQQIGTEGFVTKEGKNHDHYRRRRQHPR